MKSKRIPVFKTEDEAARFWASHDSMDYVGDMEPVDVVCVAPRRKDRLLVSLGRAQRLKLERLAIKAGIPSETLAQRWLRDRLKKEVTARR